MDTLTVFRNSGTLDSVPLWAIVGGKTMKKYAFGAVLAATGLIAAVTALFLTDGSHHAVSPAGRPTALAAD